MKLALVTALLIVFGSASTSFADETRDNPGKRYLNAHKKYLDAACPPTADNISHFVYFARDREAIRDHELLDNDWFEGAQIMYSWRDLEPSEGKYDFSRIGEDVDYLSASGKKLFIQLQDASFSPEYVPVPEYLLTKEYDGGAVPQYDDKGEIEGWVAKRWTPEVQLRFAELLAALGKEFDGRIAGLNLQESAIGVSSETDPSFDPGTYADALKKNMLSMKSAFPSTATMQYANFMPGEWLPWEDEGFLRGVYEYGEEIGVGLGAPDLMFRRKGQLNHALAMMHENDYSVPLGIAVQDGNYIGQTNNEDVVEDRKNIVPALRAFADDFLKVSHMFWVDQEPYFEQDLLGCIAGK